MTLTSQPPREDIANRGDEIYERVILPKLDPKDQGKLVLTTFGRPTTKWTRMRSRHRIPFSHAGPTPKSGCVKLGRNTRAASDLGSKKRRPDPQAVE